MIASIWDVVRAELLRLEHKGKDDSRDSWMGNAIKAINRLEEHCDKHNAYATPEVVTRLANAILAGDDRPEIIDLALAYSSREPQKGD